MNAPTRYRKRPVEVDAMPWTGHNTSAIYEFAGRANFRLTLPAVVQLTALAEVFDILHHAWIPLRAGDWIVRGPRGEHYPVRADVFAETYEPVTTPNRDAS